jgi:hypothetical protein
MHSSSCWNSWELIWKALGTDLERARYHSDGASDEEAVAKLPARL